MHAYPREDVRDTSSTTACPVTQSRLRLQQVDTALSHRVLALSSDGIKQSFIFNMERMDMEEQSKGQVIQLFGDNELVEHIHQDNFLGPQKTFLSPYLHWSLDGEEKWAVHFSLGTASTESKRALLQEFFAAGNTLNEAYFLDVENLELWVDGALAGLCRYEVGGDGDLDDDAHALSSAAPYRIGIEVQAVFVHPKYKSKGFGSALCHQLSDLIACGLLSRILPQPVPSPFFQITLASDFESAEGERFFDELSALLHMKLGVLEKAKGVPFELIEDAGY